MKIVLVCFFIGVTVSVIAQKTTLFLELGGSGGFASFNYERHLKSGSGLSFRAGVGATFFEFEKEEPDKGLAPGCVLCGISIGAPRVSLTIPISVQYLFDLQSNNYLEIGLGSTWQLAERSLLVHHASIGFRRYFGKSSKWMWKAGFTPLIGVTGENAFKNSEPTIWGGLSMGKRF